MSEPNKRRRGTKQVPPDNKALFYKYIAPNFDYIKSIVLFYTQNKQDVDCNYNHALTQMWKYAHTYNPEKSLKTWLHIVAKRATLQQDKERAEEASHISGVDYDFIGENGFGKNILRGGYSNLVAGSIIDNLSDKTLSALQRTPPALLFTFILYYQGYTLKEIVDIEYKGGYINSNGEDATHTIKHRIYAAKQTIRQILAKYDITASCEFE